MTNIHNAFMSHRYGFSQSYLVVCIKPKMVLG